MLVYQKKAKRIPRRSAAGREFGDGHHDAGAVDGEASSSDDDSSDDEAETAVAAPAWGLLDAPYKMLLCVNCDLKDASGKSAKMKPGKMAAQCCHRAASALGKRYARL